MQVAMAVEGTRGDVYPMLALGERLRAAGHAVRVCCSPDFGETVQERGFAFHPVGDSVRDYLTEKANVITGASLEMALEGGRFVRRTTATQFRDLIPGLEGAEMVIGAGVQVAAASVAELRGVPYRYVIYCPALLPSAEYAPVSVNRQTLPRWANRLAWWVTLRIMNAAIGGSVNRERARLGLAPIRDLVRYMVSERPVLAVDRELATMPSDVAMQVEQIPCLHPFETEPLPEKLASFLDAGSPPVYLGFGSMTDPEPEATTRRLVDAVSARGVRAVISRGWAGLGGGALPGEVFVTGPVNHASLFPRCAAVVHHGGAGTTSTAARAGVPQIIIPHVLDQFYWARRVEMLGLGPPAVRRHGLHAAALADAIQATLDNDVVRERAAELGARLRDRAREDSAVGVLLETTPA